MKIKRELSKEFLLLFIILSFAVMTMITLHLKTESQKNKLYQAMTERNENNSQMYYLLDEMDLSIQNYLRSDEGEQYQTYLELVSSLDDVLAAMASQSEDRPEIWNSLRRLRSFNQYQQETLAEVADFSLLERYDFLVFMKMSIMDHKNHAQRMIMEDLKITEHYYQLEVGQLNRQQLIIDLVSGTAVLICGILFILTTRKILASLKMLENNAREIARQQWQVADMPMTEYRDLNELIVAMNQMKYQLISYIRQEQEKQQLETELVQSKIHMLKAQINPHFLFNALNTIAKVSFYEPERIMELTEAISRILRYALNNQNHFVPLSAELEIVKAYILIQKTRFGDGFSFTLEVDTGLTDVMVPSMILQPLLENCFKHAFSQGHLAISLTARSAEEHYFIVIEDNGCGFDINTIGQVKGTIGLKNVADRMALEYGRNDLFQVESEIGKYTRITIKVLKEQTDESVDCRR